jgi:adiponectin receptor
MWRAVELPFKLDFFSFPLRCRKAHLHITEIATFSYNRFRLFRNTLKMAAACVRGRHPLASKPTKPLVDDVKRCHGEGVNCRRLISSLWRKQPPLPLCSVGDAPEWARGNAFIHRGYRANYSVSMCLRSLFSIHNETGNVWTHVIGLLIYIGLTMYLFLHSSALGKPMDVIHWAIFLPYIAGSMICMLFSAAFHLFSGHYCEKTYQRMLLLDYFGITCLAMSSFLPPCYLAFQCHPWVRLIYLGMISLIGSVGLVGPFCKFWGDERFFWYRVAIYCSMGVCGLFPMIHAHMVIPNGTATKYIVGLAMMMFFYASGTLIYIAQFPERLFPGRFDVWLHSHQVWHVLVLCASGVHFVNCASMYVHLEEMHLHC